MNPHRLNGLMHDEKIILKRITIDRRKIIMIKLKGNAETLYNIIEARNMAINSEERKAAECLMRRVHKSETEPILQVCR